MDAAQSDLAVAALAALVKKTPGGRVAVADAIGANEQSLYQILAGIPLKSGRARTVGRDLREKLDREFPGWLDANSSLTPAGPGTGKSLAMAQLAAEASSTAALKTLEAWRATASPKSVQVIDRLSLLAKKNMLGDEDWQLIDNMVLRLAQQPKDSKTHSLP